MITFSSGKAYTEHAFDRSGQHALCRKTLKPGMSPVYGPDGRFTHEEPRIHDDLTVSCVACLAKLDREVGAALAEAHTAPVAAPVTRRSVSSPLGMTMKTSGNTNGVHVLHRNGERALCRSAFRPGVFEGGSAAGQPMTWSITRKSSHYVQANCTNCLNKLRQELAAAEELAQQWQDVLIGMGTRVNHRVSVTSASGIAVAQGMASAGLLVRVNREPVRALHYRLTALGRRAAGLKAHTITSRIQGQEYTATGVDHVTADELAEGDVILAEVGGTLDFTRVTALGKSWIPAHVEWQGVRCNRPRQVLEVHVVGQEDALTYRLDDGVTRAS